MNSNGGLDQFEMELKSAMDAISFEYIELTENISEQIEQHKQRLIYVVEGWQLDDISEAILKQKIEACKTMYDIDALGVVFFHYAPPPSIFKNVARINADGKQYWTNAFIDYRKRNGTF